MAVLFVSTARIKRDTPMGSSVDDNLLHPQITIAQDRYILPALGTQLYEKLKELITSGDISLALNADYKELLDDYVAPCLTQFAFIEAAYSLRVRFANNTITTPDSEQGKSASVDDIKLVLNRIEDIAMFYRQRLIDYLGFNHNKYPEYTRANEDDIRASSRNYFQNINVYERRPTDNQTQAFLSGIGYKA